MNFQKTFRQILAVVLCFVSVKAIASRDGTNHGGGGGTSIATEFEMIATAIQNNSEDDYREGISIFEVRNDLLKKVIKNMKVEVSREPLYVGNHAVEALNFPASGLVRVHEASWNKIKNVDKKTLLVIHEILGLLKIVDPHYQTSGRILKKLRGNLLGTREIKSFDRILLVGEPTTIRKVSCKAADYTEINTDEAPTVKFELKRDTERNFSGWAKLPKDILIRVLYTNSHSSSANIEIYKELGNSMVEDLASTDSALFGETRYIELKYHRIVVTCTAE